MFPTSSQSKHWMYESENELNALRLHANRSFVDRHSKGMSEGECADFFLSYEEEQQFVFHYSWQLREFCRKFNPPMPKYVQATAMNYFKRFYIYNSVMDYHPKEILVTCVYLACKVEEFNVSINQFVSNVRGDKEKATDIILNNELLLMQHLKFHLVIHNPFRAVEGLFISIKTRWTRLKEPERLRPFIEDFLDKVYFTDAPLLASPSQIALAAVLNAASKHRENMDAYVSEILLGEDAPTQLPLLIPTVRKIRVMVKLMKQVQKDVIKTAERKLEKCRNQANNPDSEIYKRRVQEMFDEEETYYEPGFTELDT